VRIGKRAFYDQIDLPLDKAYELTGAVMVENMLNRDTAEGVAAFLEKWSRPRAGVVVRTE
jgi:enoyl-CoA hydratase/carnithine racemase